MNDHNSQCDLHSAKSCDSTELLLDGVRRREQWAIVRLWQGYSAPLTRLFRRKLRGRRSGVVDESDLALDVIDWIIREAETPRFSDIKSRGDFWRVVYRAVRHRLKRLRRHDRRIKRDAARTIAPGSLVLEQIPDRRNQSGLVEVEDELERFLHLLPEETLASITRLKREGYRTREIAEKLRISHRSARRKLQVIRQMWIAHVESTHPRDSHRGQGLFSNRSRRGPNGNPGPVLEKKPVGAPNYLAEPGANEGPYR